MSGQHETVASPSPLKFFNMLTREARYASVAMLAGFIGAGASVIVMALLQIWWGTPTAPELVGFRLLPQLSAGQFVMLLLQFAPHQKTGPLGLALLGMIVLGLLLGPAYDRVARVPQHPANWLPQRREWIVAGALALGMELLALALFWPVLRANLYGSPIVAARLLTLLSLLLTFAAYAAVLALADHALRFAWGRRAGASPTPSSPATTSESRLTRRTALGAAGVAVAVVAVEALSVNALIQAYLARSNLSYEGQGAPTPGPSALTANKDFYVVSKNLLDPTVDAGRWRLELAGLVPTSKIWSYDQLRALPSETRPVTLECISNEVGGSLLSTAVWKGVTLETLLHEVGGVASVAGKHVVFYSVDGYATSLPLSALLEARALLAWEMNGVPLPQRHGFPLRAIAPGRYGEQSAKWVTRIEVTDYDYKGFYQSQGWSAAQLETLSRIDTPGRKASAGAVTVAGVAFAGIRGIAKVEVSADGGATWHTATLTPPLSDQSWTLWQWQWQPATPGMHTLIVRATDGAGKTQTATQRGTVPDGSTGWHHVNVLVQ